MMLLEGQQFRHYRLIHLLKQGGMGQVYQAEDMSLQRMVAIKVISIDFAHTADQIAVQEAAKLFSREALAIAQLDHIHILPLYDSGEEYINKTKVMYMVMPLRPAGSFADWLYEHTEGNVVSLAGVERVVSQAAEALQHAHDHHIIHKDVKSSNFLVREHTEHLSRLNLQLADFGIAKVMRLTSESQIIRGTQSYMAPEQWEGHPVPATDQYALAIMAYELLTGRHPFDGRIQQQLWYQHTYLRPAAPSTFNHAIPREIDEVILRALAKNPQHRFSTITIFARAFRRTVLNSGNIYQTLPISMLEAQRGGNRIVLLPAGHKAPVSIPAGAYQGQIIRMEGYGYPTTFDGPRGSLILEVTIMPQSAGTATPTLDHAAPTEPISPPAHIAPTSPAFPLAKDLLHKDTPSLPSALPPVQKYRRAKRNKLRFVLPLLLILLSVGGLLCNATLNHMRVNALINTHIVATLTANNATATSTTAQFNTAATKTAQATSTATAQAQATTTTVLNNPYPSYLPPGNAQLALYDPLKDDSEGYHWLPVIPPTISSFSGNCTFTAGGLDASVDGNATNNIHFHACITSNTSFGNFAYEVHMTLLAGDCGGITFRGQGDKFYYFIVCQNGEYRFVKYINDQTPPVILQDTSSQYISMNLNQDNSIALWAQGTTIKLYVNDQLINTVQNVTYTMGQIGILVRSQNLNVRTEAIFSKARVWTLL